MMTHTLEFAEEIFWFLHMLRINFRLEPQDNAFDCYLRDPVPLAMTVSAEDSPANDFDCKDKEKEITESTALQLICI